MYAYFQLPEITRTLKELGILDKYSLRDFIYKEIPQFSEGDRLKIVDNEGVSITNIFPNRFVDELGCDEESCYVDISEFGHEYFLTNIQNMKYNYAKRKFEYVPLTNANTTSDKIVRTSGDVTSLISDLSKLVEVMLLFITNNLTDEQKQKFIDIVSATSKEDMLIGLKYKDNPTDFVEKFLDRQKDISIIMKDFYRNK